MSQFLSASHEYSNGMKLIRFFKVVSVLGSIVMLVRALIGFAVIGGILFLMR